MDQISPAGFAYCKTRGMAMGKSCYSYLCDPGSNDIAYRFPAWVKEPLGHVWWVCSARQRNLRGRITLPLGMFHFFTMTKKKLRQILDILCYRLFPWAWPDLFFKKWHCATLKSVLMAIWVGVHKVLWSKRSQTSLYTYILLKIPFLRKKDNMHSLRQKRPFGIMLSG